MEKIFRPIIIGSTFFTLKSAIRKRAAACPTAREDIMIGEAVRLRRPSDKTLATACSPPACTATQHPLPPSVSPASPSLSPSRPLPLSLPDRHMPTDQTHGTHALVTTRNLHDLTRSGASLLTENAKVGKKSCARGQLGRAQRVARWGHVWAQRSAACKGWPTIAPCGQGSGGRASAYRLEHTHAGLLARIPVQRHTVGPVGRLVEPNELMVPATCGGTAFEACSDSQTTVTLLSAL